MNEGTKLDEDERAWRLTWLCTGRPRGSRDRRRPAVPTPPVEDGVTRNGGGSSAARQLGAAIRARREALDISVEELGQRIGRSTNQVFGYEAGRSVPPLHILLRITIALSTTLSALLEDVE